MGKESYSSVGTLQSPRLEFPEKRLHGSQNPEASLMPCSRKDVCVPQKEIRHSAKMKRMFVAMKMTGIVKDWSLKPYDFDVADVGADQGQGSFELSDTSLIDMLGLEESLARKNVLSRVLRPMTC